MNWQPITQRSIRPPVPRSAKSGKATVLSGPGIPAALKTLVEEAKSGQVLRVMSPVIDDPDAVSWLREARQRGVVVRILTTLMDRHGIRTKGWDASESIESHGERIRELAECGCILRSPTTTPHGKFILSDAGKLWFGSANLSVGSLGGGAVEAVMNFENAGLASRIQSLFDQFWAASTHRMIHRQGAIFIEEKSGSNLTTSDLDPIYAGVQVWPSAPGIRNATCGINRLFDSATVEILLVSMSLYGLDEVPEMQQTLLRALRRGVKVRAVVRKEHFESAERKGDYPDPGTRELLDSGLQLLGVDGLHAKGFLVDDSWCGIQSANFNPYSFDWKRAECNVEVVIVGQSATQPFANYAAWLQRVAASSSHRLVD